jgi:ABC-type thiamine transport system substrate-binding protein
MPAALANSTAPSRDVIVPAPMLSFPGLALALAISSLMVFGPSLRTTMSDMLLLNKVIGAKSASGSYGRLDATNGFMTMVVSIGTSSV